MGRNAIVHELKCWRQPYNMIVAGVKKYELRKDDRTPRFEIGDFLVLREWEENLEVYTGRKSEVQVTHIMRPNSHFPGLKSGWCVMSIQFASIPKKQPAESLGD